MDNTVFIQTGPDAVAGISFGVVIGWFLYYSMRRGNEHTPSQLGVVLLAILGNVVIGFFSTPVARDMYGVAAGFFLYALLGHRRGVNVFKINSEDRRGPSGKRVVPKQFPEEEDVPVDE